MGNAESKKDERSDANSDRGRAKPRSLPDVNTNRKELCSVPVEPICFEVPDTPTSDFSNEEELEHFTVQEPTFTVSDATTTVGSSDARPTVSTKFRMALQFNLVRQLYHKFISENSSSSFDLISGCVDVQYYEQIKAIAGSVGYQSTEFISPVCRLTRGPGCSDSSTNRVMAYERILASFTDQVNLDVLRALDIAIEEGLTFYLTLEVKMRRHTGVTSNVVFQDDLRSFILPEDIMEKIFRKVAQELKLVVQNLENGQIALVQFDLKEEEEEDEDEASSAQTRPEKKIEPGELVWRRLQHWSTNVRKEKKFNIWAKGLPEFAKQKILEIAVDIGFEVAVIQPNGNIHLEIKPPEGMHRRKLKHATDEMRKELIPIDEAVCQNVEEHLRDWLAEFQKRGEIKDTLNCRFVLPAEWLRKTSEQLASHHGLKVEMATGIELLFYREDLDLSQLRPETENPSKAPGGESTASKKKSKTRKKKTSPPEAPGSGLRSSFIEECSTSTLRGELDSNKNRVCADPDRSAELIGLTSTTTTTTSSSTIGVPIGSTAGARRPVGRNKCGYGWDPNWPTAQFDNREL